MLEKNIRIPGIDASSPRPAGAATQLGRLLGGWLNSGLHYSVKKYFLKTKNIHIFSPQNILTFVEEKATKGR